MSHELEDRGRFRGMFDDFFHSEVGGSIVLLACTLLALVWANSPWAETYFHLAHTKIGVTFGDAEFALSLHHWINDGLMVVFFFVVGLEIKREISVGQLSSGSQAVLPVAAAIGGMVVPALVYAAFNLNGAGADGWGIPMATDIAFALGVLAMFGRRVPLGLKVLLTALAIADDLGAVMVIALFYTEQLRLGALVAAAVLLAMLVLLRKLGVRRIGAYVVLVLGVWVAIFASGIHATVAGILVAMVVPIKVRKEPRELLAVARQRIEALDDVEVTADSIILEKDQFDSIVDLSDATMSMLPPGLVFEKYLHDFQAFLILPLFALFNAGVVLSAESFAFPLDPITVGIIGGLVIGKQIGVFGAAWLVVKTGWASLPPGVTWPMVWGISFLAGIGFTMSLFVSELAFTVQEQVDEAKFGILIASLISGVGGIVVLKKAMAGPDSG